MEFQKLVELIEVVSVRDNCVYETKSHGLVWVGMDEDPKDGFQFVAPSSNVSGPWFRSV